MEIEIIEVTNRGRWMWALQSVGGADIYYTPGYLIPLAQRGEGRPFLAFAKEGSSCGLTINFARKIKSLAFATEDFENKIDLCSPYGFSGPLILSHDPEFAARFWRAWKKKAVELGAVSEFIRFHPLLKNYLLLSEIEDVHLIGHTVYLDLEKQKVENCLSKTCAKNIRTAYKKGLEFELLNPVEYIDEFLEMYTANMIRKSATPYYFFDEDYFMRLFDELLDNLWLARVHHQGKTGAFGLFLRHDRLIHYHLGCMDQNLRSYCPTNLLLYELALLAKKREKKFFHLGGSFQDNFGLFRFKKSFSNRTADFFVGRIVHDPESYDKLLKLRFEASDKDVENDYFPGYRSPV